MKKHFPKFVPNKPTGEDKFLGQSQKKVAKIIATTIHENSVHKKIIGLEGEWGSGKSNVVKMIEEELKDSHYTFIFDAWGSQEDLTRRSFLEQLISELFAEDILTDKEKWKKLQNGLLSKSSTTIKQIFPSVKFYWFLVSFALLLIGFLDNLYHNVFIKKDIVSNITFDIWKPAFFIYFVPFIFFIWGIYLFIKEYLKNREDNEKNDKLEQESRLKTFGKLLYWFSGQAVESEEQEFTLEEEPSVNKFKRYFSEIESSVNKKLVIVFDNIDRLEMDKVKPLWSSIHTFFAESKQDSNSWVLIPYDKVKLEKALSKNFIEKTFSISFRVTPPVVTAWEKFLKENLDYAFGTEIIPKEEYEYISKLFDYSSENETIKPRQIIFYVNELVALYKQWEDTVLSGDIRFRYLALFILHKDEIIKEPFTIIVNRNFMDDKIKTMFFDDRDLETNVSALTFGVEKKYADEVLLDRQLYKAIENGDANIIKDIKSHKAFESYFDKIYPTIVYNEKEKGLVSILKEVESVFSKNKMQILWNEFGRGMTAFGIHYYQFSESHKELIRRTPKSLGTTIISNLIKASSKRYVEKKSNEQDLYYKQLFQIEEFIKAEKLEINIFKDLETVKLNPTPFLNFLYEKKQDYSKYNIKCEEKELLNHYYLSDNKPDLQKLKKDAFYLGLLLSEYDFKKLISDVIYKIEVLNYNQLEEVSMGLEILKKLETKPFRLGLTTDVHNYINKEDELFIDIMSIAISDFKSLYYSSGNFQENLSNLTLEEIKKISKKIERYISFENLLKLIASNDNAQEYESLKDIAYHITLKPEKSSVLSIDWALENFSKIVTVFDEDKSKIYSFLVYLNDCVPNFNLSMPFTNIDNKVFDYVEMQDIGLIKEITKQAISFFQSQTKEELITIFTERGKHFSTLMILVEKGFISKFSNIFHSVFDEFFRRIARKEEPVVENEETFWKKILSLMDARKLKSTFVQIRDILINDRGDISRKEIRLFSLGLVKYGNLIKYPDDSTLKIIIPIIKYDFSTFLENSGKLVSIINKSTEYRETAVSEFQIISESSDPKGIDAKMIKIRKDFAASIKE